MTRRIALTVLALVTVLLVLAVVPLGVLLTQREETSFRSAAEANARTLASAAEENLSDHKADSDMQQLLAQAQQQGGCAAVYDAAAAVVAAAPCTTATDAGARGLVAATLAPAQPQTSNMRSSTVRSDDRLTVATPLGDGADAVGVAVLVTSTDPLDDRIAVVWGWLALIGIAGLLLGTLVSVRLARWVGRPLQAVDEAAQRLGEGALDVRAPTGAGPQEVRRLATTFNTMAARTEALVHGHRTVTADVSHQLRTPLTALRLRLDLLAADAEGEDAIELAAAQEETARLSRLVDGLLAAARAEAAVPQPVAVPVDRVVAERLAAWEPVAAERQVRLSARCPEGLTAFLGSEDLDQVLDNLLANALDAVPGGGQVHVEGVAAPASSGQGVVLRVVDDGPGMSPAARASAFRRFGTHEPGGTGLGLAIVHRLVTANGGTARLTDTAGGGLTVVLELPAVPRGQSRASGPRRRPTGPTPPL
ncbi:signal transduction histidine kinase [Kitasatospora sp. MAA4]|uniref:sensor histidine kinase n=1 Tax=Kitasatospora sp. MAA4 TaxID=3035093 RepID=UPI0024759A32|nr:HAMP domain-containing sensor histidine kinase [Kitasatospora sp. MAA4]MDH6136846.1 signal transduction histidine kinase [Kitasatospora sp. MAA4]